MYMDWKTYSGNATQNDLRFNTIPIITPIVLFFRNGKTCPKIHMQSQGNPLKSQKQLWIRTMLGDFHFQILLQTFINQSSLVLA